MLNSDHTSWKYATVGRTTMASKNSTCADLAGSTDKRSITLTLLVTLDGKILPFQTIYGGKTNQSLPEITFPAKFNTIVNEKHYSWRSSYWKVFSIRLIVIRKRLGGIFEIL